MKAKPNPRVFFDIDIEAKSGKFIETTSIGS